MSQRHEPFHFVTETHVTPIACPYCGAHAHLMRRTPHPDLKAEVRTFKCMDCKKQIGVTVKD